mgnify:CR=1 FL=1
MQMNVSHMHKISPYINQHIQAEVGSSQILQINLVKHQTSNKFFEAKRYCCNHDNIKSLASLISE